MHDETEPLTERRLTRRRLIQVAGGASLAVAAAPLLGNAGALAAARTTNTGAEIRRLLNLPRGKAAGQGLSVKMGGSLQLSGYSAFYGTAAVRGIDLARAHIKAAGGPNIDFIARDQKGADPAQGIRNG